jgi:hypothetical protein
MPSIALEGFSGVVPRTGPARLGAMNAQVARNVKLQSGELRPWRKPVLEFKPTTTAQAIYKLTGPSSQFHWLEFAQDTDVVGSPMADASDYRIYYTGTGVTPRKTNWSLATMGVGAAPISYMEMGVPAPGGAPTLSASSSSGTAESRAYVYTFVNVFGAVNEESAPSPAATVTVTSSGATVTVSNMAAPPAGNYNWQYKNIYRSVAGTSTVSYQFVAQVSAGTTSYVDSLTVTQLGAVLPSTDWAPPPATLQGIVEMPNGMLAGFTGNQVWFCEPGYPHAWPVKYMLTVEYPIVGLGVFGTSLFVGTQKNPYVITGTNPSAMSQEKLSILQACVSKRSIVSDQWGVVYASPNGLVAVGPGIQDIVTQNLYTRDEWQPLNPSSIIGALYNNMYLGFYNNGLGPISSFIFTRADTPPLTMFDFDARCVFIERSTGNFYALSNADNTIYQLDADADNNTIFQWKSRQYILPEPLSFAALKIHADYTYIFDPVAYAAAINALKAKNLALWNQYAGTTLQGCLNDTVIDTYSIDGSVLLDVPRIAETRSVQVTVFCDGIQVFQTQATNNEPIRMPGGFKGLVWEVMISGNAPVRKVALATSILELRQV